METESQLDQAPRFEDLREISLDLASAITDFPPVGFVLGAISMAYDKVKARIDNSLTL